MVINYSLNPMLPALGWVAEISENVTSQVSVMHGQFVEPTATGFFEGAWAGDFREGRPDLSDVVFGTGAVALDNEIVFVSSTATTDYVFYGRSDRSLFAANSLALLLASVNDELDPHFTDYAAIHDSILAGVDECVRVIPTRNGSVSRLMYFNLSVHAGITDERAKPEPPHFPDFDSYAAYLADSYASLVQNATDESRRCPLKIYTTQSRGYDSTAINAIASRHRVDGVFTVTTGKASGAFADEGNEAEVDDDGSAIARSLGLVNIRALQRRAFRSDFSDEMYFYASIHEPQDANLKEIVNDLAAPALLLTGTLGELWYTKALWYDQRPGSLLPDLRRGDLSLHGLTEFRIRSGFIQAAIPYIGARRREEIVRITESAEMIPWRLGTSYDRPIPRRLAESAGVARHSFGQVKIGSVVEFTPPHIPRGRELRNGYFEFLKANHLRRSWQIAFFPVIHSVNRAVWFASESQYRWVYYTLRVVSKIVGRSIKPAPFWSDLRGSLHCYAVNRSVAEYAVVIRSGNALHT